MRSKLITLLVICSSYSYSQTFTAADTSHAWMNGWNECYNSVVKGYTAEGLTFEKGFYSGWYYQGLSDKMRPKVYEYFSTSVVSETLSVWVNKGYLIYYFGSQSATTKKIPVRGLKLK